MGYGMDEALEPDMDPRCKECETVTLSQCKRCREICCSACKQWVSASDKICSDCANNKTT